MAIGCTSLHHLLMVNLNLKIFGVSSRAQISMIWATFSHFPPGIEHSQPKFQRFEPRSPGSCIAALPHFSWGLFHDWPCHRRCLQLTLGLLHRSSGCQTPVGWLVDDEFGDSTTLHILGMIIIQERGIPFSTSQYNGMIKGFISHCSYGLFTNAKQRPLLQEIRWWMAPV